VAGERSGEVTQLLVAIGRGEKSAHDRLWELVYEELRVIARHQMASEASRRMLQPTALVHEVFVRLVGDGNAQWNGRGHFFSAAAKAMRRIRIDDARRRKRLKRGGGRPTMQLGARQETDSAPVSDPPHAGGPFDGDPTELLALDEALRRLEQIAPRQAQVVMLRYFAGLTIVETAEALGVAARTVNAEWRLARAWLHRELGSDTTVI